MRSQIIQHLNDYNYIYTFFLIVIVTIILNLTKGKSWLIKKQNIIAPIFATLQLSLFIWNTYYWISLNYWWSLLLHDLCPALSFLSIIVFYLNKESIYKAIMPWLLIGSTITMFTGYAGWLTYTPSLSTYLEHTIMLMQGILAYFWVSKYRKIEFIQLLIFPACLIVWILLTALLPWQISNDAYWAEHSTGLLLPSILPGKAFDILGDFIDIIPYPIPTIAFYVLAVGTAMLISLNKNTYPFYKEKIIIFSNNIFKKNKKFSSKKINKF